MNRGYQRFNVRLQRPDLAEPILQRALLQSVKTYRRHAMILSDLALSALVTSGC